jgi:uncharacterized ubiquitin-like protein YukD
MTKATAETLKLILIIALGLIIFLSFVPIITNELSVACKRSQIDDLGRVLTQLENFESMSNVQTLSYNTVEGFVIKTCTKEIVFEKTTENNVEKKYVKVVWEDGIEQKIPTVADWKMGNGDNLWLNDSSTWDMKVSYRNVIARQVSQTI